MGGWFLILNMMGGGGGVVLVDPQAFRIADILGSPMRIADQFGEAVRV